MMRIAMMGDYPPDPDHIGGGVEAVTHYLLEGLSQQYDDLDLHMVTLRSDVKQGTVLHDGVTVHYLMPHYRRNAFTFDAYHRHLLKEELDAIHPDIVHAHVAETYPLAAYLTDFPTVLSLHGIRRIEMSLQRGWRNQLYRRWIITHRENTSIRKAKYIIAISPTYIRREFNRIIHGEIYDIENPVKSEWFSIKRCETPNCILFAGRIILRKGVLELLQSIHLLRRNIPNVQVRLAGRLDLEPDYVDKLKAYIAEHHLENHITFLGPLDEKSLIDEYAKCALLVLPSCQETAPMVIEQAMAASIPVVATRVGGVDYLVDEGRTGHVVEFGDIKGLAKAIQHILSDANLRAKMGKAAQTEADKRFRADVVARQTREVYDRVLCG